MQVTQEQISPCELELQIELDAANFETAYERVFREVAGRVDVPGFRKGKAPRPVLENYVDTDKVQVQAADELIRSAYAEALQEINIQPFVDNIHAVDALYHQPMGILIDQENMYCLAC